MKKIRAIQTSFKGYLFRSRLEARWAVFFDYLGLSWEYEKEGFDLPTRRYLPDFWIADKDHPQFKNAGYWLEIKPFMMSEEELNLLGELAAFTGHNAYGCCGNIGDGLKVITAHPWRYPEGDKRNFPGEKLVQVDGKTAAIAGITERKNERLECWERPDCWYDPFWGFLWLGTRIVSSPGLRGGCHPTSNPDEKITKALQIARSARWEHGQTPERMTN